MPFYHNIRLLLYVYVLKNNNYFGHCSRTVKYWTVSSCYHIPRSLRIHSYYSTILLIDDDDVSIYFNSPIFYSAESKESVLYKGSEVKYKGSALWEIFSELLATLYTSYIEGCGRDATLPRQTRVVGIIKTLKKYQFVGIIFHFYFYLRGCTLLLW